MTNRVPVRDCQPVPVGLLLIGILVVVLRNVYRSQWDSCYDVCIALHFKCRRGSDSTKRVPMRDIQPIPVRLLSDVGFNMILLITSYKTIYNCVANVLYTANHATCECHRAGHGV